MKLITLPHPMLMFRMHGVIHLLPIPLHGVVLNEAQSALLSYIDLLEYLKLHMRILNLIKTSIFFNDNVYKNNYHI
jgi:hypothetical protein